VAISLLICVADNLLSLGLFQGIISPNYQLYPFIYLYLGVGVSALQQEIDKEIELHKKKIAELEQLKIDQEKKIEGFTEFDQTIKRLCNQMALTEAELYVSRGDQIVAWIQNLARAEQPGRIYETLKKHFEKTLKKEERKEGRKDKQSSLPKPKLAVGRYKNPATHESIEKIKRNPRQLEDWINEYGFETVRTWKM